MSLDNACDLYDALAGKASKFPALLNMMLVQGHEFSEKTAIAAQSLRKANAAPMREKGALLNVAADHMGNAAAPLKKMSNIFAQMSEIHIQIQELRAKCSEEIKSP